MTHQFRKRPVLVLAEQFNPNAKPVHDITLPAGVRRTDYREVAMLLSTSGCSRRGLWSWHVLGVIETLDGLMVVEPGDWVITGVQGERYPCKPDIFAATYEVCGETQ